MQMDEGVTNELRAINRERFHLLWIKAKNSDMMDVTDEEKRIMKIMLDHEDEYSDMFDNADRMGDHEFDPETEENPFAHITMHSVVETQLEERNPIEVYQFYNAMRKKKCSHHETLHLLATIFSYLLFDVLKDQVPFDLERYKSLLSQYKNKKPEKVYDLLNG
jgi:hypothetical protein